MNRLRPILGGIKGLIAGLFSHKGTGGTGGTASSRYCYSVWLKHLYVTYMEGMQKYPNVIAELGPGNSIGVGLAGLIGGAQKYYALDVVRHVNDEHNVKVFRELISLFKLREDIPDDNEFPKVYPRLRSYKFISTILKERHLKNNLTDDRIERIKNDLLNISNEMNERSSINYICPWFEPQVIKDETVDMVYSQAVLEHVDDLEFTYGSLFRWIKKGGYMSHQIDFKSHRITDEWNGHLSYSDFAWKLIRGNRPYLINRQLLSTHVKLQEKIGFRVISIIPVKGIGGLTRHQLSRRYRNISEEDFTTSSAHIISKKE